MLQLTPKANGLQGGFSIPDAANGATVTNMTANFKLFIGKGSGNAADGFSFNFATDIAAINNTGEEGSGSGITVSFDTYDNGGGEAPAISIKMAANEFVKTNVSKATLVNDRLVDVTIRLNSDGTLDVIHDGTTYFNKVDLVAQGY